MQSQEFRELKELKDNLLDYNQKTKLGKSLESC